MLRFVFALASQFLILVLLDWFVSVMVSSKFLLCKFCCFLIVVFIL